MVEQERDRVTVGPDLLRGMRGEVLSAGMVTDGLLDLVTLRYTECNSVAQVKDGTAIAIGTGQQSRVDCVKLAAAKSRTRWLRRHPTVRATPRVEDRDNGRLSNLGRAREIEEP